MSLCQSTFPRPPWPTPPVPSARPPPRGPASEACAPHPRSQAHRFLGPLPTPPLLAAGIDPQMPEAHKTASHRVHKQPYVVLVGHFGAVAPRLQDQSFGIYQQVALRLPSTFLAGSKPRSQCLPRRLSVVLSVCESTIPALETRGPSCQGGGAVQALAQRAAFSGARRCLLDALPPETNGKRSSKAGTRGPTASRGSRSLARRTRGHRGSRAGRVSWGVLSGWWRADAPRCI
jgi:hypothetical protein